MTSISARLAAFGHDLRLGDIPREVQQRALHSMLDAVGVALAASKFDFARDAAAGISSLSDPGGTPVIGMPCRLQMRDAAFLNGFLIHGLDFDDTHLLSAVHPTASLLPTIMALGYRQCSRGEEMLTAYVAGMEAIARLGRFGGIRLRDAGSHPTSSIAIFGCVIAAAKLLGLSEHEAMMAQGIALAMTSGVTGAAADGASNKRLHPGWAAQSAITAAYLARAGVEGPGRPYEGVRGIFRDFDQSSMSNFDVLTGQLADLGTVWETANVAIKPIPACHLTHACSDAAIALRKEHGFAIEDIVRVDALVPEGVISAVCEPVALKRRPAGAHAAQFSIPYIVAASLIRERFGLEEISPESISDPEIMGLADLVEYVIDPHSTYPVHRTGEVHVYLRNGTVLREREAINRGAPDRPLSFTDIRAKFDANATRALTSEGASRVAEAVLAMASAEDGRRLVDTICVSAG